MVSILHSVLDLIYPRYRHFRSELQDPQGLLPHRAHLRDPQGFRVALQVAQVATRGAVAVDLQVAQVATRGAVAETLQEAQVATRGALQPDSQGTTRGAAMEVAVAAAATTMALMPKSLEARLHTHKVGPKPTGTTGQ